MFVKLFGFLQVILSSFLPNGVGGGNSNFAYGKPPSPTQQPTLGTPHFKSLEKIKKKKDQEMSTTNLS